MIYSVIQQALVGQKKRSSRRNRHMPSAPKSFMVLTSPMIKALFQNIPQPTLPLSRKRNSKRSHMLSKFLISTHVKNYTRGKSYKGKNRIPSKEEKWEKQWKWYWTRSRKKLRRTRYCRRYTAPCHDRKMEKQNAIERWKLRKGEKRILNWKYKNVATHKILETLKCTLSWFPNFSDATVCWKRNFVPHFMMEVITYPYWV